jgi:hypothetical protein
MSEDWKVEAYAGAFYPERPVSLLKEGRKLVVVDVVKQWRTPDEIHFEVVTDAGDSYELIYSFTTNRWQVVARELAQGGA